MDTRPDPRSRTRDGLATIFRHFAEEECPQLDAWLYQELCRGIAGDAEMLDIAARAPAMQPPPNLIFAGVHYLLLGGRVHALRRWYPALADGAAEDPATAFPVFRAFCLENRAALERLIETRLTQTNVIQRCSVLLPAFARIFARQRRPLAMIEIGPSAGLNLQWSRYRYAYRRGGLELERAWGDASSRVVVDCELRGARLPELPDGIPLVSRCGIDIHPIDINDADAVLWLRALVWPDHVGRQERLTAAIDVAREDTPALIQADASEALPDVLASVPVGAVPCVYGTHTLYQFPRDALLGTLKAMQAAGRERPTWFVSLEGGRERSSELRVTEYRGGERETTLVARANPHGRWLDWLDPEQPG